MNYKDLKKNTWYATYNILFLIKKEYDEHPYARDFGRSAEGATDIIWVQNVDHMNKWIYEKILFEVHTHMFYNYDRESSIAFNRIREPSSKDFKDKIKAIFEFERERF